jgi:two-component system, response regulator / RNA-binding antiterminator
MDKKLQKIAVVGDNEARTTVVLEGLKGAGYLQISLFTNFDGLMRQLIDLDPDAVVIDLANPQGQQKEQLFQISQTLRRPVAMFVDQSDRETMVAALEAGVNAFVVDGLKEQRVATIVDMAIARFNSVAQLKSDLEMTRAALQDRKIIERAKGILMVQKNMDEAAAYALLRSSAMNRHIRMAEIAQSIVTAAEIMA